MSNVQDTILISERKRREPSPRQADPTDGSGDLERIALNQKRAFNRAGEAGFAQHNPFASPIESNFAQHAVGAANSLRHAREQGLVILGLLPEDNFRNDRQNCRHH